VIPMDEIKVAKINEWGDVECPTCGCEILTPPGYDLVPGVGQCPFCQNEFRITELESFLANVRFPLQER
jgi:hypothetical protein